MIKKPRKPAGGLHAPMTIWMHGGALTTVTFEIFKHPAEVVKHGKQLGGTCHAPAMVSIVAKPSSPLHPALPVAMAQKGSEMPNSMACCTR